MYGINTSSNFYNYYNNYNNIFGVSTSKSKYYNTNRIYDLIYSQNNKYQQNLNTLKQYNKDATKFYSNFNDKFADLKLSSNKLKSYSSSSVLNPIGYESDNNDVISLNSSKTYDGKKLDVNVSQVATSQTTTSNAYKSDSKSDFELKKGSIAFDINDSTYTFNLKFGKNTTNKSAMEQIASQVNSARIGITANVIDKDGKSSLEFKSNKTGENSQFTAIFEGDLKGINLNESQKAQDAKYTVNGKDYTSESNEITLEDGSISATLKSAGTAKIQKGERNNQNIIDSVKEFAKDYNDVLSFLDNNSDKSREIDNLSYSYKMTRFSSNTLSKIGIEVDNKGRLNVDDKKLNSALEEDFNNVKNLLGGTSGLASTTYTKTNRAIINSQNLYPEPKLNNYKQYNGYTYSNFNNFNSFNNLYSSGIFLNFLA